MIRLDAENPSTSCLENAPTLENSSLRRVWQRSAETLAARTAVQAASRRLSRAQTTIAAPSRAITSVAVPACRWSVMTPMYSGMRRSRYTCPAIRKTQMASISRPRQERCLSIIRHYEHPRGS